jgi:cytochrome c-type biogenesis protein CcmH/NrfG
MAADRGKVLKAVAMVVTGLACKTKCRAVYQSRSHNLQILDEQLCRGGFV